MSSFLVGDEAGSPPDAKHLEHDVQRAIVDFVAKLLVVGLPLYAVFVGVEFVSGSGSAIVAFQAVVVTTMSLTIWFSRTLATRGTALVLGTTTLGVAALFHFGPMLGTGLFYVSAVLLSSFLGNRQQTAAICILLSVSIVMPAVLGVGPEVVKLDDIAWLRIALATSFPLIIAAFLFRRIRAAVSTSLQASLHAAAQARELDEERRRLFVAAMQAQRLESLGRLSGEVAHEFNNALVVVRGGVDLLADSVDEEGEEVLEMMATALDTATNTARSLLDFSRDASPSSGRADLGGVAEAVAGRLRPIINQSVTLDLEIETALTVPLEADDLEQVVLNLLLNSVDAMPDGGTIGVRARAVDAQAVLSVTDDGVGMTDEAVARVFEPFYTTKSEDGTGLGLAVVYGHVTRCGGTVEAESVLGEGTILTVSLPLVNEG